MIVKGIHTLVTGGAYFPKAIRVLFQHPRLWIYCIAPSIITLILGIIWFIVLFGFVVEAIAPAGVFSGAWYMDVLAVVTLILTTALSIIVLVLLINVIAGPFNEVLSQKVEEIVHNVKEDTPFQWRVFIKDSIRAIKEETKTFVFIGGIQLGVFLLNVIPGIGSIIYTIVNIPLLGFLMAYEYLDLPLSRHGNSFKSKLRYITQQPIRNLGFGWVCALVMFIPVLNIVFLPVCVIAGTLLYCEHEAANNA